MPTDPWARWLDEVELKSALDRQTKLLRSQVRDRVLFQAGLRAGHVVVDLGCGLGLVALEAARLVGPGGTVYAVDSGGETLRILAEKADKAGLKNLRTIRADISRLPFADAVADAVVARSVLSYILDRRTALAESFRVLRPGGRISLCEPVLAEEELLVNWGEDRPLWEKAWNILRESHPAFSFRRFDLVREVREAGFEEVDYFVWYADVTRLFWNGDAARRELAEALPGELSLLVWLRARGMREDEIERLAMRLASESRRFSYRDILPCCFVWGRKPSGRSFS